MMNEGTEAPLIQIHICYAPTARQVWTRALSVSAQTTAGEALVASGFSLDFPDLDPWQMGVGVFGCLITAETVLQRGDRLEIYRGLYFDPKESRRRRAEHRRAKAAVNGRVRPAGLL